MLIQFATPKEISRLTGMSIHTCKSYRYKGLWIEGIHWQRVTNKSVLYNVPLIMDWIANRTTPERHEQAIARYLESLPSSPENTTKTKAPYGNRGGIKKRP